jgi:hypothetical protein
MRYGCGLVVGLAILVAASACGPRLDLHQLGVTDTFSGFYDNGLKDGKNHLVPSITFRLQNNGSVPATHVELTVAFWKDGDDGELDGREVLGIGADPVAPGQTSNPILVRSTVGYTLDPPQPRAALFEHSGFKDFTAKILAKRDGNIVRIAEVKIDRRLIPRVSQAARVQ